MRKEYDFSNARKNPYAKRLKRQVTMRLDTISIDYFKRLAAEMDIPYQNLINLYLMDCANQQLRPTLGWTASTTLPKAVSKDSRPRLRATSRQVKS